MSTEQLTGLIQPQRDRLAFVELNGRMNRTLEAVARALFKSWFVGFDSTRATLDGRKPGIRKEIASLLPDAFEDSGLGEIPIGWKVQPCHVAERRDTLLPRLISSDLPVKGVERSVGDAA